MRQERTIKQKTEKDLILNIRNGRNIHEEASHYGNYYDGISLLKQRTDNEQKKP